MTFREVIPGVHRFCDGLANWYAVEATAGLVLIDCGWPTSHSDVVEGLRAIGRRPEELRAVLLTHGHADHLGSARKLEDAGVAVFAHEDELERVRGGRPPTRSAALMRDLWRPQALAFVAGAVRRRELWPDWPEHARPLSGAEADGVLDGIRVIATPGHTEGHVAYQLAERGVIFSGDALVTVSVLTGRSGPQLHPAAFQVDLARARESLSALAAIDGELLLPGHGEPHHGAVAAAVEAALSAAPPGTA